MTETRTKNAALSGGPAPDALPAESGTGESAVALLRTILPTVMSVRDQFRDASGRYTVNSNRQLREAADLLDGWLARARVVILATELLQPHPNTTAETEENP